MLKLSQECTAVNLNFHPEIQQQSMKWKYSGLIRPKKFRILLLLLEKFLHQFFGIAQG